MKLGATIVLLNWGGHDEVHAVITKVKPGDKASICAFPPMQSPKLIDDVPVFVSRDAAFEWQEAQRVQGQHIAYLPDIELPALTPVLNIIDTAGAEARLNELLSPTQAMLNAQPAADETWRNDVVDTTEQGNAQAMLNAQPDYSIQPQMTQEQIDLQTSLQYGIPITELPRLEDGTIDGTKLPPITGHVNITLPDPAMQPDNPEMFK